MARAHLCSLLVVLVVLAELACRAEAHNSTSGAHHGIHVASWRWEELRVFYTFTLFIVICGLAKIGFHHAHFLSDHIPESCLMIIVGVTVGSIITFSNADNSTVGSILPEFTPTTFFYILLPPVILEAAYSLYDRAFADNIGTVMLYAVVGTLFNTFTIGPLLYVLYYIGAMGTMYIIPLTVHGLREMPYSLTMTDCLVFSALISAVDPVAVLAIFQEIGVNKDLYYLVFGESLFNDAVTVVLYSTMVVFNEMHDGISGDQYILAILAFFASSLGGLAIGIIFGLITALITKTTQEIRVVEPLAVLGIAYLSYLSAELFHFSGIISIIGCGLVQAHYALRNVSHKSYTTIIYFTKMLSSTSDAIIFLFLGVVLVSQHHVWHTGFVLWTLVLCLVCRFAGVFSLTYLANIFRVSQINLQEQFIMAYGGLRGAVAFSLVLMLDERTVEPKTIFITTTLVVIFFTVFIQGGTIKPLVALLKIKKEKAAVKSLNVEINENIISNIMAGIEEITGVKGDFYIRQNIEHFDENYMQKIFLVPDHESDLTKLYKELSLVEHYAHLYGPVALIEDNTAELFRNTTMPSDDMSYTPTSGLIRRETLQMKDRGNAMSLSPGVELRRRLTRASSVRGNTPNGGAIETPAELRKVFKNYPNQKFPRNNPEGLQIQQLKEKMRQRHLTARCITALVNRQSLPVEHIALEGNRQSLPAVLEEHLETPKKRIHSGLDGIDEFQQELDGIDAILERAGSRRLKSASEHSGSTCQSPYIVRTQEPPAIHEATETEMDVFLPNRNSSGYSADIRL